jgi:hypothetical protein
MVLRLKGGLKLSSAEKKGKVQAKFKAKFPFHTEFKWKCNLMFKKKD